MQTEPTQDRDRSSKRKFGVHVFPGVQIVAAFSLNACTFIPPTPNFVGMEALPQTHAVMRPEQVTELEVDQRARLVSEIVEVAVEDKQISSGQQGAGADQAVPNRHLTSKGRPPDRREQAEFRMGVCCTGLV